MPLALSPVLSLAITYIVAWPVLWIVGRIAGRCVCVVQEQVVRVGTVAATAGTSLSVLSGTETECAVEQPVAAAKASGITNGIHWLNCGMISFARGWNDTPKIAALVLLAFAGIAHGPAIGVALVTGAMALGGLLMGRRVLDTLARKLTPLPLAESLTASFVTATLVGLASWNSLPVSTTHVATGSIIGAGLKRDPGAIKWGKFAEIVLSWVITLPVAALIAATVKLVVH
jgi:PiT family inorganic phosphate transporter